MKSLTLLILAVPLFAGVAAWFKSPKDRKATLSFRQISCGPVNGDFIPADSQGSGPRGMVWIPRGIFSMGTNSSVEALCERKGISVDASPVHQVEVNGFWMDEHEVTNAEYAGFVKATGYKTIAELEPSREEFPEADPSLLVAGSVVFSPPGHQVAPGDYLQWWLYVPGASWKHPVGPTSSIVGRENYLVVHIAWEDAVAYAAWAGKRLPTEAEWEFAARGGLNENTFAWGNEFTPGQHQMANTFQGSFPANDLGEDSFKGLAPVKQYPKNGYGLFDMSGNVWEWCADWYRADYYESLSATGVTSNPKGPSDSFDPMEPGIRKKVQKGGSFLCTDQYCSRYIMGTRGKGDWRTGASHTGFRCVKDFR